MVLLYVETSSTIIILQQIGNSFRIRVEERGISYNTITSYIKELQGIKEDFFDYEPM